ncbi:MAG TPA: sensor domain-containing diguanylate cyclase [Candidatus Limnocylindrales bacterium]|jgi:diguanylate cyclase (GGDEF)-like protein
MARASVVGGLVGLIALGVAVIVVMPGSALGWLVLLSDLLVMLGLLVVRRSERRIVSRDRTAQAGLHRLLQGLGRSTSPDAVVATIVDALRGASEADHVVLARRRPGGRDIEAILVTTSASVPLATTHLPADLLPSSEARGGESIDPLVERLRAAFGLRNVIARPLVADADVVGALVLSQRTEDAWSAADVALLETAATELSVALQRAAAQEAAELGARIDALTRLPNRRHFDELAELVSRGRRAGDALGMLMIDIDHFKRVNDTFGHAVGDAVLQAVAASIASAVRAEDTPARVGGEEFAVLLRRATVDQACDVALRIREAVAVIDTAAIGVTDARPVSVSVGVAVGSTAGETVADLVHRADDALYAAKRRGRDRVVVDELGSGIEAGAT